MSVLGDDHLWHTVEVSLREAVLPHVDDPAARLALVRVIAIARWARHRPDPAGREAEVAAVLGLAADTPPAVVAATAAAALAAAAAGGPPAPAGLREVLLGHLDEDLAVAGPLLGAFRGRLP